MQKQAYGLKTKILNLKSVCIDSLSKFSELDKEAIIIQRFHGKEKTEEELQTI